MSTHHTGRVYLLPGIANVRFQLKPLAKILEANDPSREVVIRPWGPPLLTLPNLFSYDRNRATAREFADEIASFKSEHPDATVDIVAFSGGCGMAMFTVESLPDGVQVDRLLLLAAAASPQYPICSNVIPHVRDQVVSFSSTRDLQVGIGTRLFGTMDRVKTRSAGFTGFDCEHPKLKQVSWTNEMARYGHLGNHLSYLRPKWQERYVVPYLSR